MKNPLFFSFWSSCPLLPIKLIQLPWCPLVLVYFPFWSLLAVWYLWVEGGISGPLGKESVPRTLTISGVSDGPHRLGSPGIVVDSCSIGGEMNLLGLPSVSRLCMRKHLAWITSFLGWEVIQSPASVLFPQSWGLKPAHFPLPPFRVPLWLSLEVFAVFIIVLSEKERAGQDYAFLFRPEVDEFCF